MNPYRRALITAALVTALAALACDAKAQPGGGGRGGGRGGFGGPGGWGGPGGFGGGPGGFGGGPGGRGGSLLNLAMMPPIQQELKLKDTQKAKLQALNETVNQRRQQLRDQMTPPGQQGQRQGGRRNQNNGNAQAGGGGGFGGGQAGGGGFGGDQAGGGGGFGGGQAGGGGFGGGQNGGGGGFGGGQAGGGGGFGGGQAGGGGGQNGGGQNGGRRGRGQIDPEMAQRFAAMREAQTELEQSSEQTLAKILDRGQYGRLKQIKLQRDGLDALTRPEMVEKLSLSDEQVVEIRELLNEGRQAQRENGRGFGEVMKNAPRPPGVPQDGQNGQNGQNANNGGRGGGRNRPNFQDPAFQEAMQKFREQPEVKAKMDQMRTQGEKIQKQLTLEVNRVLGKRQAALYKRMLGAPFEMALLRGGPPGGGPGNRNGNQANTTKTAKGQTSGSDDDEEDGAAATAKPAPKASKPATAKPKRKSLRELRGLDE